MLLDKEFEALAVTRVDILNMLLIIRLTFSNRKEKEVCENKGCVAPDPWVVL